MGTSRRRRASCTTRDRRRRREREPWCTGKRTRSTKSIDRSPRGPSRRALMASPFNSAKEFRAVMDRVFTMMSEDAEMGPRLRDADVPQRFEFEDFGLVMNIRAGGRGDEPKRHWEWTDEG